MPDTGKQCAVTIPREGRHCKHPRVAGTDYCRQHQRESAPTEEDRVAVLKALVAPGVTSLASFEIRDRILGIPAGDGRTREHQEWMLRSLTLIAAVLELHDQGLIYEAVPADGVHPYELKITDTGREVLALERSV